VNAGIYARLSVLKVSEGATEAAMDRQEDDCRRLCEQRGWNVVNVYPDEGVSAYQKGRKRPAFEEALADLESGRIDVLVAWKLDRLVRRLKDWVRIEEAVEKSGGRLVSAQEGEQSDLTLRILASMAEQESKNTSTRLQRQRRQAAIAGEPNQGGRRLYGFSKLPRTIVEDEAKVIREAVRRLLSGSSQRSVTAWMNTVSQTTTGKQWSQRTVREMLLSPALAGHRVYKGEIVATGTWEPILEREQWEQLAALLRSRPRRGAPVKHLLSGIVACGREDCGAPLITHYEPKARGGRRQYWCPKNVGLGRPGCGRLSVAAEALERVVAAMVLHRLSGPGMAKALAARDAEQGAGVAAELAAVEAQTADIEEAYKQRRVRIDAFLRVHEPLVEQAEQLRQQLRQGHEAAILHELPQVAEELEQWWTDPERTTEERRAVIQAVCERVVVGPAARKSRVFDQARIRSPFGPQWRI
jgi:DNA invertase Pin-like site-specific DNA recombinase